ncbi:hypothetical protein Tco_0390302 [Tanacetum coccineum]
MENEVLTVWTFALFHRLDHREGCRARRGGIPHMVTPRGSFTPLETIQRLLVVIGIRSHSDFEGEAFKPERRDVNVILPKKSQTILDAPLGYIGLYTHHFSLSNFRLPIPPFICGVLNYFKVHISHFNPFCMVELTTFAVMCKAYEEMDFRSFMLEGVDGELNFLPAEGVRGSVTDSYDPSYGEDEQTLVGPSLPLYPGASKKLKIVGKRKVSSGVSGKALPLKVQKVSARASKVAGEASTPLDVDSDPDIHEFPSAKELRDATDCHWVVAHVTHPSWKQRLREISIEHLCDIHDRAYMRQAVLDNLDKDRAYAELERKCNEALQDLDKNPLVFDMHAEIKVLQGQVDGPHSEYIIRGAAMKLVYSDDLGVLIAKLVKSSIIYGRCQAFEEVAAEEPFILEKMSGYQPSSKEEYDRAGDALENTSYPFLAEYVVNPYASLE